MSLKGLTTEKPLHLIQARGVKKAFGLGEAQVQALSGVDFSVAAGEFVAIMGPSGSGKSTFLYILGAIDVASEGQVLFEGLDLATLTDQERTLLRRKRIGFVFQAFNLIPGLTARENVALPLILDGTSPEDAYSRAQQTLELVQMSGRQNHYNYQLSAGEQQRVAIARALIARPALILADEPTGNLDTKSGHHVISLLRELVDLHRQTIVMVTHDPDNAGRADRIVHFRDGLIVS